MQDLKKTTESKSTNSSAALLNAASSIQFQYIGLTDYQKAYDLQLQRHSEVQNNSSQISVIGVEHPAVLTLGYRAQEGEEVLAESTLPVVRTGRGGLATIHSEGQLVIYPILDLRQQNIGVRDLVQLLLLTTQQCLQHFGVSSNLDEQKIGLYTEYGKIAFCGLQIKNGISLHGLSLNVKNDLSLFNQIIACGVRQQKMDAVNRLSSITDLKTIFDQWSEIFETNFRNRQGPL